MGRLEVAPYMLIGSGATSGMSGCRSVMGCAEVVAHMTKKYDRQEG